MIILLTILHVLVCLVLIVVVLLQSGKAGDISSAFGGMGSQTAFGPRSGATLLTRVTTTSAILFMVTSLSLTILTARQSGTGTVMEGATAPAAAEQPATPPQTQTTPQFGPSEGGNAPAPANNPAPASGDAQPKN